LQVPFSSDAKVLAFFSGTPAARKDREEGLNRLLYEQVKATSNLVRFLQVFVPNLLTPAYQAKKNMGKTR